MPTAMPPGRLITIEGIDGAGKTTLAQALASQLNHRGVDVRVLREPGGVAAAERIREVVKDPATRLGPRAEALLYAAARAQLVEEAVDPLLRARAVVLLDRFVDSSLAYQGAARGLGVEAVRAINEFGTHGLVPDRTLLLDVDVRVGRSRARHRDPTRDRLERERDEFFSVVAAAYLELWRRDPRRVRRIDASRPFHTVLAAALEEIADLL
ncbi:MAG: dTMP kinase [Solirubrobacterales bacterium]|nr:dTMP kinase [Solirubrobacterales bacterium]MBV9713822.1 dTMP kinase [Solirubrobacterales bacterium]